MGTAGRWRGSTRRCQKAKKEKVCEGRRQDDQSATQGYEAENKIQKDVTEKASGHLNAVGWREFRVGFADDAVASVAFGRIEASIGALDQGIGIIARLQHRHAD